MREIKFRVYDTVNKCFISDTSNFWINPTFSHMMEWHSDLDGNIAFELNDSLVFQQFTGLTDRNGQEIYEGDIILVEGSPGMFYTFDRKGPVEWNSAKCQFVWYWQGIEENYYNSYPENLSKTMCEYYKVIGDINGVSFTQYAVSGK